MTRDSETETEQTETCPESKFSRHTAVMKYRKLTKYILQQCYEFLRPMLSQFCSVDVRLGSAQRTFPTVCKPL
jgi:hypothetical protein